MFPQGEEAHGEVNGVEQTFKVSHLIILEMFPKISFSFTVKGNYYYSLVIRRLIILLGFRFV